MMKSLSYRNQSTDLQSKSLDWFLYDKDFRHERVKGCNFNIMMILRKLASAIFLENLIFFSVGFF